MRVLSINIRATQGGAGRMGYDLHKRIQEMGHSSRLLYGYGSGIAPDSKVENEPDVKMIGSRPVVIGNYIAHWSFGREILIGGMATLTEGIRQAEVIHVHAAHHWYLNWNTLIAILGQARKPVVITAHDWWLVTGRCGFVRECTGWHRACGECGDRRFEDLPSLFDRSRSIRAARQRNLRTLRENLTIVCPSQHLHRDHERIYPDLDTRFIPNALDREYESAIAHLQRRDRRGIVFCASDLASPGKIDPNMVRLTAAAHGDAVELVGRNNPFHDIPVVIHGEVRDRVKLAEIFARAKMLVFTSQMDNAPLTIIEALVAGCYVVAYPSPAAAEMLALVGGRCASSPEEALALISAGHVAELYSGLNPEDLARRASEVWSGQRLAETYLATYAELIARREGQAA